MSTPDFRKVRFVGPLSVFASEWGEHLLAVGYTPSSATAKLQLAADLSRWMDARRLSPSDLTGPVINEFVRVRRATHTQLISLGSARADAGSSTFPRCCPGAACPGAGIRGGGSVGSLPAFPGGEQGTD